MKLVDILKMKKVAFPKCSVIVEHGYLLNAWPGYKGNQALPYHIYLIQERATPSGTIVSADRALRKQKGGQPTKDGTKREENEENEVSGQTDSREKGIEKSRKEGGEPSEGAHDCTN